MEGDVTGKLSPLNLKSDNNVFEETEHVSPRTSNHVANDSKEDNNVSEETTHVSPRISGLSRSPVKENQNKQDVSGTEKTETKAAPSWMRKSLPFLKENETDMRTDKKSIPTKLKPNNNVSQKTPPVSPKITGSSVEEKNHEPSSVVTNSTVEENQNVPDIVGTDNTESKTDAPSIGKLDSPLAGDVTGIHIDNNPVELKPDNNISQETAHVSPKSSGSSVEVNTTSVVNDSTVDENQNKRDVIETEKTESKATPSWMRKTLPFLKEDVKAISTNKKSNPVKPKPDSNVPQETTDVSHKIPDSSVGEKDHEPHSDVNDSTVEENQNRPESEKTESTADSPKVEKSDSPVKENGKVDDVVVQPPAIDMEPVTSPRTPKVEKSDSPVKENGKVDDVVVQPPAIDMEPVTSPRTPKVEKSDSPVKESGKVDDVVVQPPAIDMEPMTSPRTPKMEKSDSPVKENGKVDDVVVQLPAIDMEPVTSPRTPRDGSESTDSTPENSNKIKNVHVPTNKNKSEPNSPRTKKPPQHDSKKQSVSAKNTKFKPTVPVAPVFVCGARAERRKQFYSQLEERQAAMEAEKREYEARKKEKEQATLRQLRMNMAYKANPMPAFYQEGPPPKTQLKKLPVTRPKSPKLNRRKSCGDSDVRTQSSSVEKRKENQRSVGSHRNQRHTSASPLRNKEQVSGKNGDETTDHSTDCSKTVSDDASNCSETLLEDTNHSLETAPKDTDTAESHRLPEETSADIAANS